MSRVPPVGVASPLGYIKKRQRRIEREVSSRLCASRQDRERREEKKRMPTLLPQPSFLRIQNNHRDRQPQLAPKIHLQ